MVLSILLAAFTLLGFYNNILIASIITILYIALLIRYLFKKADYLNEILKATKENNLWKSRLYYKRT